MLPRHCKEIWLFNRRRSFRNIGQFHRQKKWISSSRILANGMSDFLEFEREMARKKKATIAINSSKEKLEQSDAQILLNPPIEPKEEDCCGNDCANCVWIIYQEKLLDYEDALARAQNKKVSYSPPKSSFSVIYHSKSPEVKYQLPKGATFVKVVQNVELCNPNLNLSNAPFRTTKHLVLSNCAHLKYETGDNLAVYVPNEKKSVKKLAQLLGFDLSQLFSLDPKDKQSDIPIQGIMTIANALDWYIDISSIPRRRLFLNLVAFANTECDKKELQLIGENEQHYKEEILNHNLSLTSVVEKFSSIKLSFEMLLSIAGPILPRYYTISSSPSSNPERITLTVRALNDLGGPLLMKGRCSNYLSTIEPNSDSSNILVSLKKSKFKLPKRKCPVVMIGAGTGIAPFRGFLNELKDTESPGARETLLFYGCQHPNLDLLYKQELNHFVTEKILSQLFPVFSRYNCGKSIKSDTSRVKYVQELIEINGNIVHECILQKSGSIFICGSTQMGKEVERSLCFVMVKHSNMSLIEADRFIAKMKEENRYIVELWTS